jgi:heat shock protein HslJ
MIDIKRNQYRLIALSSLLLSVIVVSACAPTGPSPGDQQPPLAGTNWLLVQINGQPPLAGTQVTLTFEGASLGGMTGCNHFGGDYASSTDGTLTIRDLVQTEMYCMEPEGVMAQEIEYLETLRQAASYQVVDERLEIMDQAGVTMLIFEQS